MKTETVKIIAVKQWPNTDGFSKAPYSKADIEIQFENGETAIFSNGGKKSQWKHMKVGDILEVRYVKRTETYNIYGFKEPESRIVRARIKKEKRRIALYKEGPIFPTERPQDKRKRLNSIMLSDALVEKLEKRLIEVIKKEEKW